MFDLIGYWGAVTFFTSMILVWVLPLCILVLDYLIIMITKGDYKWVVYEKTYKRFNEYLLDRKVHGIFSFVTGVYNLIFLIAVLKEGVTLLSVINSCSILLTPVFSYLSILTLSWFTFLLLGRFVYSLSKDIATLKAKAAKKESNNDR